MRGTRGRAAVATSLGLTTQPGAQVQFLEVLADIELATSAREDHSLLACGLPLPPNAVAGRLPKRTTQMVNKANLQDLWMQRRFQDVLWTFEPSAGAYIDEHHLQFTEFAKQQAIAAFGAQPKLPRQP